MFTFQKIPMAVGLALMFSLLAPMANSAHAVTPCSASAGSAGFQHGSYVSGSTVIICAVTNVVVPARTVTTVVSGRTNTPGSTAPVTRPPAPRLPAWQNHWQPGQHIVVAPVSHVVTTPQRSVTPPAQNTNNGQAIFTPSGLVAAVSPSSSLTIGQAATLTSNAKTHFRQGIILGRSAEVRFLLQSVSWKVGSATGSIKTFIWSPDQAGNYSATVKANYSVAYRFLSGGAWVVAANSVTLSDSLALNVDTQPQTQASVVESSPAQVLLVGAPCSRYSTSFGCH